MIDTLIRQLKRFAVLIPGIVVTYFVTADIYPFLDRSVPDVLAVLTTYVLAAYVLIPALIRVIRTVVKPKHIPLYCVTPDGFASDPINIGMVGSKQAVMETLKKAGWYEADPRTPGNMLKMAAALVFRLPYPNAPFSNLYLFGRKQDFGFQLPVENSPHHRHHVRFWACAPGISELEEQHITFWQKHLPGRKKRKSRQLWVGAASLDVGLGIVRHSGQLTHMVDPDTNAERELLVKHLKATRQVAKTKTVKLGEPYKLRNRVLHAHLHSDGKMTIVTLK